MTARWRSPANHDVLINAYACLWLPLITCGEVWWPPYIYTTDDHTLLPAKHVVKV